MKNVFRFAALGLAGLSTITTISACNYRDTKGSASTVVGNVSIVMSAASKGNMAYMPTSFSTTLGTTVTWVNDDTVNHTITADNSAFDSGIIAAGQSYTHTFTASGTFTYHCDVHPSMTGTIVVQ